MIEILVAEDDEMIANLIKINLVKAGYLCTCAYNGKDAANLLDSKHFDLCLFDIMLPEIDGYELLEYAKSMDIPSIFITAMGTTDNKVKGLRAGADDYIAKPFRPRELVLRIKNALRRAGKPQAAVSLGDVRVDLERGACFRGDTDLCLSALEYRLLLTLINNRGHVLTRAQLLEHIWDVAGDFVNDNTLTVYIKRLREKLEADPQAPCIIKTVRGVGYKID